MNKKPTSKAPAYPLGIIAKDLEYPKMASGDSLDYNAGDCGHVTLYEVAGRRQGEKFWVVCTLGIAKNRRGYADRSYGVRTDGSVVRVGHGPHVLQTITVHVRKSRVAALAELLKLHREGAIAAHQIRDRIGSRRAEGQLRRAAGQRSWMWDN